MLAPCFIPIPSFTVEEMPVQHEVMTYVRVPYPLMTQLGPKSSPCDSHVSVVLIRQCDCLRFYLLMSYLRLMARRESFTFLMARSEWNVL